MALPVRLTPARTQTQSETRSQNTLTRNLSLSVRFALSHYVLY